MLMRDFGTQALRWCQERYKKPDFVPVFKGSESWWAESGGWEGLNDYDYEYITDLKSCRFLDAGVAQHSTRVLGHVEMCNSNFCWSLFKSIQKWTSWNFQARHQISANYSYLMLFASIHCNFAVLTSHCERLWKGHTMVTPKRNQWTAQALKHDPESMLERFWPQR